MIRHIKEQLAEAKMPAFWQFYALIQGLIVISVYVFANDFWRYALYPFIGIMIVVGLAVGVLQQVNKLKLWYTLVIAVIFFEVSIVLQSLIYFGFPISTEISFYIKEIGIGFSALFTLLAMLFIERKFKLRGLVIDFGLISISIICFLFIARPDYLDIYLFHLTTVQQLSLFNIILGSFLLVIGMLHVALAKFIDIKSFLLILIVGLFIAHFSFSFLISLNYFENETFASKTSWFFYQILGFFSIFYSYLERFELKFARRANSRLSFIFMWLASIFAILTVPIATLITSLDNKDSSFYLITSISSLVLGSIIIWRFILLILSSDKQRKQLKTIAHTDELTGALNYLGYCEKYSRSALTNCLVIVMDIDDFKSINDLYGRNFGDMVLKRLFKRLMQLESVKLVSRVGPDNFITLFQVPKNDIESHLKSLRNTLGVWDIVDNKRVAVPLTFGASHSKKISDIEVLTRQAEKALKIARNKRVGFSLYTTNNNNKLIPRHEIRGILQQALDKNFLPVHFQPIYNLEDGSLKAIELLIRMQSSKHGLLLPGQFLDQARSYGLLTQLTKVCVHMIAQNYHQLPKVIININLPPYMLENPRILGEFLLSFKKEKLSPKRFCIEVTEDEDIPAEHLLGSVKLLKKVGFSIAMDDFGTGYSSLARLSMLPFDIVKIDRSILLAASSGNKAILESTITLIKRLGLAVVVEGVETLEQLSLIQELGANSVQGFLLSKPVDVNKAINLPLNAANIIAEF